MRFNRKAQINNTHTLIGVVTVVVILLFLGIVLATSQKSLSTIRDTGANNVASQPNDTFTFQNGTALSLVQNKIGIVSGSEKVYGYNGSSLRLLNQGRNYTINYDTSTIVLLNETSTDWFNTTNVNKVNVSYDYYYGSGERNITVQNREGIKVLQDFQPTWATIIAVFVVLLILSPIIIYVWNKLS